MRGFIKESGVYNAHDKGELKALEFYVNEGKKPSSDWEYEGPIVIWELMTTIVPLS